MTPALALMLTDTVFGLIDRMIALKKLKADIESKAITEDDAKARVNAIRAKAWDEPIPEDE